MKTFKLNDGYIELKESGNTYVGEIAHKIMHEAELIQRKAQRKFNVDVSFNHCLTKLINQLIEQGKI